MVTRALDAVSECLRLSLRPRVAVEVYFSDSGQWPLSSSCGSHSVTECQGGKVNLASGRIVIFWIGCLVERATAIEKLTNPILKVSLRFIHYCWPLIFLTRPEIGSCPDIIHVYIKEQFWLRPNSWGTLRLSIHSEKYIYQKHVCLSSQYFAE